MDIKVSIQSVDGGYTTDTPDRVADIVYRYDKDFEDDKIEELATFCRDYPDEKYADKAKILEWLLESRREVRAGKYDLGQIKIDMYKNTCTEPIKIDDLGTECTFARARGEDKVIMAIIGNDENGPYEANNLYTLEEFLAFEEGSLEVKIGETLFYNKIYPDYGMEEEEAE